MVGMSKTCSSAVYLHNWFVPGHGGGRRQIDQLETDELKVCWMGILVDLIEDRNQVTMLANRILIILPVTYKLN